MAKLKCTHGRRAMILDGGKIIHRSTGERCEMQELTFAGTPVSADTVYSVGASIARATTLVQTPSRSKGTRRDKPAEKRTHPIYVKLD